jgi:hypothetical protein
MTINLKLTARIFFAACILLVLSCNKILDIKDLIHQHDNDKLCKVLTITSTSTPSPYGGPVTAQFSYNKNGDPTSVIFNQVGTGRPNLIFRYDKYGRLTDYAGPYTNGMYEFWHHYQYLNNRIVSDTLFGFGEIRNDTLFPSNQYALTTQFEYDAFGRIIKTIQHNVFYYRNLDDVIIIYKYDNNGNLSHRIWYYGTPSQRDEVFTDYDNQVNIHRTSNVFMFVDANYSINNPIKATSYNNSGLPLAFNSEQIFYYTFLYQFDIIQSTIVYKCK